MINQALMYIEVSRITRSMSMITQALMCEAVKVETNVIDICECGGVVEGTISHIKRRRRKKDRSM